MHLDIEKLFDEVTVKTVYATLQVSPEETAKRLDDAVSRCYKTQIPKKSVPSYQRVSALQN